MLIKNTIKQPFAPFVFPWGYVTICYIKMVIAKDVFWDVKPNHYIIQRIKMVIFDIKMIRNCSAYIVYLKYE